MEPLSERELEIVSSARRAVLATIGADGAPRLVPITFVFSDNLIWTPLDDKPKRVADPRDLARVHDIEARPRVSVLVDAWDEDWTRLGWVRMLGSARLVGPDDESEPEHSAAVRLLREKYAQYASHDLDARPLIRIVLDRCTSWLATP